LLGIKVRERDHVPTSSLEPHPLELVDPPQIIEVGCRVAEIARQVAGQTKPTS